MTKKELEKEVEDKGVKYADSLEYTISKFSDEEGYCWSHRFRRTQRKKEYLNLNRKMSN